MFKLVWIEMVSFSLIFSGAPGFPLVANTSSTISNQFCHCWGSLQGLRRACRLRRNRGSRWDKPMEPGTAGGTTGWSLVVRDEESGLYCLASCESLQSNMAPLDQPRDFGMTDGVLLWINWLLKFETFVTQANNVGRHKKTTSPFLVRISCFKPIVWLFQGIADRRGLCGACHGSCQDHRWKGRISERLGRKLSGPRCFLGFHLGPWVL